MHWLLYRRLGVATGLGRTARRALAVGLVLLWIPPVVAVGAGNAYSPQPIRPIVWWGEVWLAVIFYLNRKNREKLERVMPVAAMAESLTWTQAYNKAGLAMLCT